jgi:hypothetical protein
MINAGNILLMLITNNDVQATGKERRELAQFYFNKIKDTVKRYREERNFEYLVKISLWVVIATFILIIILIVINNIFLMGRQEWSKALLDKGCTIMQSYKISSE